MGLTEPPHRILELEILEDEALGTHIVEDDGVRYLVVPDIGRALIVSDPKARGFGLGDILSIDIQSLRPIADTLGWSIVANGLYDLIKDGTRRVRAGARSFPVSPEGVEQAIGQAAQG